MENEKWKVEIDHNKLREPFKEDEIQWRVITSGKKANGDIWAIVAPYVDSRAIMDRLDIVVGINNWESHFTETVKGMICELTICGVTKSDGADYTDIEPTKGGISDALKRAGNQWGMGRYLYSLGTNYAIITDNGKHGGYIAKDKTKFKWNPPKLPAWALPQGSPETPNTGQPPKPEGVKQPVTLTFTELCKACHNVDPAKYKDVLKEVGLDTPEAVKNMPTEKQKAVSDKLMEAFKGEI